MSRPLIGVTTSEVRPAANAVPLPQGEPKRTEMALGMTYMRAVEASGGLPVVMPPLEPEAIGPLLERVSAVCLSGGPDLDPTLYGESAHPELGPTELSLDRFEIGVAIEAHRRGLPIFAICRGAQALNVALGGSLYQHLPDRDGSMIDHRQTAPGTEVTHPVEVAEGSRLGRLLRRRRVAVNSFHHQAVKRLGRGLTATAWAPDGVIEGIEEPAADFVVGVQWHAETLTARPEEARLFDAFVEAARRSGRSLARWAA